MPSQHPATSKALLTLLVLAACTESATAPPRSAPLSMESSTLFSGGEGVLVSESFRAIELAPLTHSLEVIPRRWSNFQVLFAGDTVDSWRIADDRIAFRVPPSYSGTYSIEIRSSAYAASPIPAKVIGAAARYSPSWGCVGGYYTSEFVPIGPEELLLSTYCWRFEDMFPQGVVRLTPGTMFLDTYLADQEEWADELWFNGREHISGTFRGMWAPGPSSRPGLAVVERYPESEADSSSTWVWRFGREPGPVEPIECLPADNGWGLEWGFTAAEIAPGVCLSVTEQGEFFLNGSQPLITVPVRCCSEPSFRVSRNGTAALRNVALWNDKRWPVFRPTDGVAFVVEYSHVKDVAFSPAGDTMYVTALLEDQDRPRLVLDVRDVVDGALTSREELECRGTCASDLGALARTSEHLWSLRHVTVDDDRQARLELRDPTDLTVLRSVAVPVHPDYPTYSFALGDHPVLLPDATGRRAYIFSEFFLGHSAAGYLMELY